MMDEEANVVVEEIAAEDDGVGQVRALILSTYADLVPELIAGETVGALIASVEPARAAYQQIKSRVEASVEPRPVPPPVPAGATVAIVDPATLPAHELIRRGIEARR